jgi:hypothetical protein
MTKGSSLCVQAHSALLVEFFYDEGHVLYGDDKMVRVSRFPTLLLTVQRI